MARYAKFFSLGAGGGGTNNLQLPVGTILDATLRQVQDGLGTGSPLYLSTRRVGITSDSSVTTQTSSVIQATTTNANLVIAPNGTGAITASIPDGTATGGNARGQYAVDLKPSGRTDRAQVASGNYSAVIGGNVSTASGFASLAGGSAFATGTNSVALGGSSTASGDGSVAIGGEQGGGLGATASGRAAVAFGMTNQATANWSNCLGGFNNTASTAYSVVSGGQSNTASTGTNATVVGGQSNTASGVGAVTGGRGNTASGAYSVAFGEINTAATQYSTISGGRQNSVTGSQYCTIGGGSGNSCGHFETTIAGGMNNANNRSGSFIGGGNNNTIGSAFSVISGGAENQITAAGAVNLYATIAGGYRAQGYLYGGTFSAAGYFAAQGDAQQTNLTTRREASLGSAATTILSLDGTGTTNLIIPNGNNRLWAVKVVATAFVSVAGGTLVLGDSYMGEFTLLFKRVGGTSSVVGVNAGNIIYDTNMATAAFTFAAGASQDLQITFKAPTTASATTFRCVAKVELVEVAY